MSIDAYFTRPLKTELLVSPDKPPKLIASLGPLRGGSYVVFAKMIVVTRFDQSGDSALAMFSLEAGSSSDRALCALWHSKDPGSLQPADTISLQLPVKLSAIRAHRPGTPPRPKPSVRLFCNSVRGTLELKDLVITAIRIDSLTDMSPTG